MQIDNLKTGDLIVVHLIIKEFIVGWKNSQKDYTGLYKDCTGLYKECTSLYKDCTGLYKVYYQKMTKLILSLSRLPITSWGAFRRLLFY